MQKFEKRPKEGCERTEKEPQTSQIRLFLCTPKRILISGPDQVAHAKIIGKRPKKDMEQPKRAQNPLKILNFDAPQRPPNINSPPNIGQIKNG